MQQKTIAKKQASFKLLIILLASFCVLCLVGSTLAWFTHYGELTGSGTTPSAQLNLHSSLADYNNSGNPTNLVQVNGPVFQSNIGIGTTSIDGTVQFDCGSSNIDLLAVVKVEVNFLEEIKPGEFILPPQDTSTWYTLNISNSIFTKGTDDHYYYNTKITKSNASNKITIFDNIAINNTQAENYTMQIVVYVQVVQANQLGLTKLTEAGYVLPQSFSNLV